MFSKIRNATRGRRALSGFTLIELLVVIAIIGILASLILVALGSARNKGKDARATSDINQVRTQIETEATSGGAYTAAAGKCITAANTLDAAAGDTCTQLVSDASTQGVTISVHTPAVSAGTVSAYAVFGTLNSTAVYCVDSTGKTGTTTPGAGVNTCP